MKMPRVTTIRIRSGGFVCGELRENVDTGARHCWIRVVRHDTQSMWTADEARQVALWLNAAADWCDNGTESPA